MTKKTKIVNIEGDVTPKFKSAFAAALAQVVLTGKMPRAKKKIVMRNGKAVIVPISRRKK
jgi:hypothetical protein